ncbi:hypothetical protein CR956_00035 [Candidatus Saccharibacteria bacterium]|nr:MAG: hypothetical protein CR956_00035 [Candidatus Saccharibacteria bacterium]
MIQTIFAYAAMIISIGSSIPYIIETIQGKVKPERVSWFIWVLLGIVYFWTAVVEEGAVVFSFGELIGPTAAFLLALKFGVGGKSRLDIVMLIIALVAIVLLFFTEDPLISLLLALLADSIAMFITLVKFHGDRSSESRITWAMLSFSAFLALLSLKVVNFETLAFPVYSMVTAGYIAIMVRNPKLDNADAKK